MKHSTSNQERCLALVAALNDELAWGLDPTQQRKYVADLLPHITNTVLESELRKMVEVYHDDHATIEALVDRNNPEHEALWRIWLTQAVRIIRSQNKNISHNQLLDEDDLVQTALEELLRSLPTFHYRSRFSTWVYTIITRHILRSHRHFGASKRKIYAKSESLDAADKHAHVHDSTPNPETSSQETLLWELVSNILDSYGDERLSKIFDMWIHEDMRLADIGRQMHLSPASISRLVNQICALLRQDPKLSAWLGYHPRERAKGDEQDRDDAADGDNQAHSSWP